jgi:hypothetical protein
MSVPTLLLILALICFIIAAASIPTGRIQTVALGLAFWVGSILVGSGALHR